MRLGMSFVLLLLLTSLGAALERVAAQEPETDETLIERGRYLATRVGSCIDCHTPHVNNQLDESRLFSGHPQDAPPPRWDPALSDSGVGTVVSPLGTAFAGPWGVSFASNLTPDPNTGLGAWNEALFIRTMRRGDFQAPMPAHLKNLTRSDLKAIWAYLQTLESIYNGVPQSHVVSPEQ